MQRVPCGGRAYIRHTHGEMNVASETVFGASRYYGHEKLLMSPLAELDPGNIAGCGQSRHRPIHP
ncbi:protein of unknown function [Burkholderia multivorans]